MQEHIGHRGLAILMGLWGQVTSAPHAHSIIWWGGWGGGGVWRLEVGLSPYAGLKHNLEVIPFSVQLWFLMACEQKGFTLWCAGGISSCSKSMWSTAVLQTTAVPAGSGMDRSTDLQNRTDLCCAEWQRRPAGTEQQSGHIKVGHAVPGNWELQTWGQLLNSTICWLT